jgi:uncharacterized protein
MTSYRLTTEVFALPRGEHHIVYAPLCETSMLVNGGALAVMADIAAERDVTPSAGSRELIELLLELDLIRPSVEGQPDERRGGETREPRRLGRGPADGALRPVACTLFLTTDCNLRCLYCYASGGEQPRYLDERIALDAIELIVRNAAESGAGKASVTFHGGGEPTLAAAVLRRCVDHARRRCDDEGLELSVGVATNGVMSESMRDYLAAAMTSVVVSIDGPAAVQNRLRPLAGGGPSSAAVERTLERLSGGACSVGARLTCTSESIEHAYATVCHLVDDHALSHVHLEPLFVCGRSVGGGLRPPDPERFVEVVRACRDYACRRDVKVAYSGARQSSLTSSFCQASTPSFNVTTEGDLTACYEVTGRHDPRAETFIYGSHQAASGSFVFDEARLAALRRLTVHDAPRCAHCFAKYHCAGDCPSKRLYPGADDAVIARCEINRCLTLDQLEEHVLRGPTATSVDGEQSASPAAPRSREVETADRGVA